MNYLVRSGCSFLRVLNPAKMETTSPEKKRAADLHLGRRCRSAQLAVRRPARTHARRSLAAAAPNGFDRFSLRSVRSHHTRARRSIPVRCMRNICDSRGCDLRCGARIIRTGMRAPNATKAGAAGAQVQRQADGAAAARTGHTHSHSRCMMGK